VANEMAVERPTYPVTISFFKEHQMKIEDFADNQPAFVLEQFFAGRTQGWDVKLSRFETLQNQFRIEAEGQWGI
jgi:hypothetical protein